MTRPPRHGWQLVETPGGAVRVPRRGPRYQGRVTLRADGETGEGLSWYRALIDGVQVGDVYGVEPSPWGRFRPTAWVVSPYRMRPQKHDRLSSARCWLEDNADELLAAARAREEGQA